MRLTFKYLSQIACKSVDKNSISDTKIYWGHHISRINGPIFLFFISCDIHIIVFPSFNYVAVAGGGGGWIYEGRVCEGEGDWDIRWKEGMGPIFHMISS